MSPYHIYNVNSQDSSIKLFKTFSSLGCNSLASKFLIYVIKANAIIVAKSTIKRSIRS